MKTSIPNNLNINKYKAAGELGAVNFGEFSENEKFSDKQEKLIKDNTKVKLEKIQVNIEGKIGLDELMKEMLGKETISKTVFLANIKELGVMVEKQGTQKDIAKIFRYNLLAG